MRKAGRLPGVRPAEVSGTLAAADHRVDVTGLDLPGRHPTEEPAILSWNVACLGDPAYDLAVVSRGSRTPFGLADGFGRLLAAYAAAGVQPVRATEVRLYELCIAVRWYEDALCDDRLASVADDRLRHLRKVLGRGRAADQEAPATT